MCVKFCFRRRQPNAIVQAIENSIASIFLAHTTNFRPHEWAISNLIDSRYVSLLEKQETLPIPGHCLFPLRSTSVELTASSGQDNPSIRILPVAMTRAFYLSGKSCLMKRIALTVIWDISAGTSEIWERFDESPLPIAWHRIPERMEDFACGW